MNSKSTFLPSLSSPSTQSAIATPSTSWLVDVIPEFWKWIINDEFLMLQDIYSPERDLISKMIFVTFRIISKPTNVKGLIIFDYAKDGKRMFNTEEYKMCQKHCLIPYSLAWTNSSNINLDINVVMTFAEFFLVNLINKSSLMELPVLVNGNKSHVLMKKIASSTKIGKKKLVLFQESTSKSLNSTDWFSAYVKLQN